MGITWKNIHPRTYQQGVFLAFVRKDENGKEIITSKSKAMTNEIAAALMEAMQYNLLHHGDPEDKPYIGYQDKHGGTLIYILPGWTFGVRRQGKRE